MTPEAEISYIRGANSQGVEQRSDPRLLADIARILLDCGLRPEGLAPRPAGSKFRGPRYKIEHRAREFGRASATPCRCRSTSYAQRDNR